MRIAFVVPTLQRSGGILVVTRQVRLLRARTGLDAAVVVLDQPPATARDDDGLAVLGTAAAASRDWDVAVWTWWTTMDVALELRAARRVLLLQGLDERFYRWWEPFDRLAASAALAGADAVITVSAYLGDVIAALRPEAEPLVVRAGLDRAVFAPRERSAPADGPLRVLVEGQPGLWMKGVDDALAAVGAMREPAEATLVSLAPKEADELAVTHVVGGLAPSAMADLYAGSDVVLKLSRGEGLGMAPLEAAAVGTPSIVTPYGGHADWLEHGVNGVQALFDDVAGTAAWLDVVARNRALLRRLGDGALATAAAWPTVEEAADGLAAALRTVADRRPAGEDVRRRALARSLARNVDLGRLSFARRTAQLRVAEQRVAHAERHLELLVSSTTYRLAERLRTAWWAVRRPLAWVRGISRGRRG
jgi:glycosyltransferase involved in cell wall biosynthesis